jgi:hypothetical protein
MKKLLTLIGTIFFYFPLYSQNNNDFNDILTLGDIHYPTAHWGIEKFRFVSNELRRYGYFLVNILCPARKMIFFVSRQEADGKIFIRILDFDNLFSDEMIPKLHSLTGVPLVDHLLTFLEYSEDLSYQDIHRIRVAGLSDDLSYRSQILLEKARDLDPEIEGWLSQGDILAKQQIIDFFYLISTWDKKFDFINYDGIYYLFLQDQEEYDYPKDQPLFIQSVIFSDQEYHLPIYSLVLNMLNKIEILSSDQFRKYKQYINEKQHLYIKDSIFRGEKQLPINIFYGRFP